MGRFLYRVCASHASGHGRDLAGRTNLEMGTDFSGFVMFV
jgi:hypothetical protein